MTKTICDICEEETTHPFRVEVLDGEHPHNGSTMTKDIDVCDDCIRRLKLRCNVEFDELRQSHQERELVRNTIKSSTAPKRKRK